MREVVIACSTAEKFLGGFAELEGLVSLFSLSLPRRMIRVKHLRKPKTARSSPPEAEQLDWHGKCH